MGNNKFQSRRPELTFTEATNEFNCSIDDLIYEGSIGQLTLYVMAHNWNAKLVHQIDSTKDCSDLRPIYSGPPLPPMPNSADPDEYKRQADAWIYGLTTQDITVGNKTRFGINGPHREFYLNNWSDLQPITAKTFLDYLRDKNESKIELNLNKMVKNIPDHLSTYFCPNPEVRMIDAIDEGKLFVMKADLQSLASNNSLHPDDIKPKGGVHRKNLLKLVIGMAVDQYGYDHTAAKSPIPLELQKILELQGIECSDDTIRKALKEAATVLPQKTK